MDLNKHLQYNPDGSVTCLADKIVIYISKAFDKYKLIKVTDTVQTIAIFEITIDGETRGMFIPAVVTMVPSFTSYVTVNGKDYVRCEFTKGDVFMKDKTVVKTGHIAYIVFSEFIEKANVPDFIKYADMAFLFDTVKRITGCKLPAEHAAFEMIYAFLARDAADLKRSYRLTAMQDDPKFLPLKDVPHAAQSTTARLIGAYLKDSLASSMVNASEDNSDIEDLLRH